MGRKRRARRSRSSRGERGRLALAIALARPSNLLILDEPTNDLDLETLDLLEEILADYAGTVLLVSHDRDFLDRVVTSTITLDPEGGPGAWREYAGGYTDMVRQRGGAATAKTPDAVKPGPSKAKSPDPASSKAKSAKLSYKDKYALETLPGRIETLTGEIETHKATLADPELFAADPDLFSKTADALAALEAELAQAEETWLEAAMRAEELG